MTLITYLRRFAKYALYLVVLAALILFVMGLFSKNGFTDYKAIMLSSRVWYFGIFVVGFALIYPFMGYSKKLLTCNAEEKQEDVARVMLMCGYALASKSEGVMTFRAQRAMKRVSLMGEDKITISTNADEGLSTMSGPRKEVVRAAFRIGTYIA